MSECMRVALAGSMTKVCVFTTTICKCIRERQTPFTHTGNPSDESRWAGERMAPCYSTLHRSSAPPSYCLQLRDRNKILFLASCKWYNIEIFTEHSLCECLTFAVSDITIRRYNYYDYTERFPYAWHYALLLYALFFSLGFPPRSYH